VKRLSQTESATAQKIARFAAKLAGSRFALKQVSAFVATRSVVATRGSRHIVMSYFFTPSLDTARPADRS
jgi:hypothetical protein